MVQHHKWNHDTIESMYPYERDLYVDMLMDYLEKEKERLKQKNK